MTAENETSDLLGSTVQARIRHLLVNLGLPYKEIKVYGSQVVITAWSESAGRQWRTVLCKFCSKVRGPKESLDYNQENRGTNLLPTTHKVWLVWGTI